MHLKKLTPILWVKDLQETISFYTGCLGFVCRYRNDRFAVLQRDLVEIMVIVPVDEPEDCKDRENSEEFFHKSHFTGSIYIDTEKVDDLWKQGKDKAKIKYGLTNQEWMVRDFSIWDNNGYEVVVGQDISDTGSEK